MTDLKTPLAKVRGLGSAKSGTHHWLVHRITAIANIPLVIFAVASAVGLAGKGYDAWAAWLAQPLVAVLMTLFAMNIFYHLRLGLQVLVEDYVQGHGSKFVTMLLINFAVIFLAAVSVFSILKVAFGG